MENKLVTVNVMLDEKTFRKFVVFNYLNRERRWISPFIFTCIMSTCACLCFIMRHTAEHAVLLGCVLLLLGLGLPAFHLWSFFSLIKSQVKAYKLEKPQPVYSLKLSDEPDGVYVTNPGGESAQYEWSTLHSAYRVAGCVYLYVSANKAFLLPDGQAEEGTDALWSMLTGMLPPKKLHDRLETRK